MLPSHIAVYEIFKCVFQALKVAIGFYLSLPPSLVYQMLNNLKQQLTTIFIFMMFFFIKKYLKLAANANHTFLKAKVTFSCCHICRTNSPKPTEIHFINIRQRKAKWE